MDFIAEPIAPDQSAISVCGLRGHLGCLLRLRLLRGPASSGDATRDQRFAPSFGRASVLGGGPSYPGQRIVK